MTLPEIETVKAAPTGATPVGAVLCDPECECLRCKLRYWRKYGMRTHIPAEWSSGPTVREQVRQITDSAKAEGRDISYVGRAELT